MSTGTGETDYKKKMPDYRGSLKKTITAANLPDLEERAKSLGLTMEQALRLVNVEQVEDGGRRVTNYGSKPLTENHHIVHPTGKYFYFRYIKDKKAINIKLTQDIETSRIMRDKIYSEITNNEQKNTK